MSSARILVVEDELIVAQSIKETLERSNYQVVALALSKDEAIQASDAFRPDVVLMDIRLDDENAGIEAATIIRERFRIPIIYLTAYSDEQTLQQAKATEPFGFLSKPFTSKDLYTTIEIALYKHQTEQKLSHYREHLEDMVQQRTAELTRANTQLQQEIHDRRQAEQALRASAGQYRALIERVADGILIFHDEQLVFVNAALCDMFGYTRDEFLQMPDPIALLHEDYLEFGRNQLARTIAGQMFPAWQAGCTRKDGRMLWVEIRHSFIDWQSQTAMLVTVRNITEQKEREREVQQEHERLRQVNLLLGSTLQDRYRFGEIIGKSQAMRQIYELILQAADSDENVLIHGESGTGKELIAQTVHNLSERRHKAFVPVNCGAIPAQLFESEFFGHRKGAFTGAHADKPGLFDAAHQGTLFLDEVGELNPAMQVKLLRALEGRGYTEVGGHMVRRPDVRIIAATNRNLEELLRSDAIREDFFYRIHVLVIRVPSLRERKDDIPLLVEHFFQCYRKPASGDGKGHSRLSGDALDQLYAHSWPGNVRELQNVLRRYITTGHLDFSTSFRQRVLPPQHDVSTPQTLDSEQNLRSALDEVEKQMILAALREHGWHRAETAKTLGLPTRTLHRKMTKYQLVRS